MPLHRALSSCQIPVVFGYWRWPCLCSGSPGEAELDGSEEELISLRSAEHVTGQDEPDFFFRFLMLWMSPTCTHPITPWLLSIRWSAPLEDLPNGDCQVCYNLTRYVETRLPTSRYRADIFG